MAEPVRADPPPAGGGGKKIAGLPRGVVFAGIGAVAFGIFWYIRKSQQASAAAQTTATPQDQTDFAGELSTLQSEFGNLASEIAAMQGSAPKPAPTPAPKPKPRPKQPVPKPKGKRKPKPKPKRKPKPKTPVPRFNIGAARRPVAFPPRKAA